MIKLSDLLMYGLKPTYGYKVIRFFDKRDNMIMRGEFGNVMCCTKCLSCGQDIVTMHTKDAWTQCDLKTPVDGILSFYCKHCIDEKKVTRYDRLYKEMIRYLEEIIYEMEFESIFDYLDARDRFFREEDKLLSSFQPAPTCLSCLYYMNDYCWLHEEERDEHAPICEEYKELEGSEC